MVIIRNSGIPKQDAPPPGGFPKIKVRRVDGPRGPSGIAIFSGVFLMMAYGVFQLNRTYKENAIISREQRSARAGIMGYLMAEYDASLLRQLKENAERERKIMANYPAFKPDDSVFKSAWSPPLYQIPKK